MKIIRVFDKKVGNMEYYKYRAPLPKAVAEESGLIGRELKITVKGSKIVIEAEHKE